MAGRRAVGRPPATVIVGAVLAIGSGVLAATDPAGAAPSDVPRQVSAAVDLDLVDQHVAFVADGPIRLVYRVTGDIADVPALAPPSTTTTTTVAPTEPEAPPAEPPVPLNAVVVNYERLDINDDLDLYVGDRARTAALAEPIDGVVVPIAPDQLVFGDDGSITLELTIGTDSGESVEELVKFDEAGLYPLTVTLVLGTVADGVELASHGTIVQRLPAPRETPAPSPPIDLAVVAAIGEVGPDPDGAELRGARRELDAALALADGIASPVTLSVPPVVIAAAAADDPAALASSLAGDHLVSLPATPLNVSSAAGADRVDAFARQLREGEDLLTAALPTTPARRAVWIATEPLSAAGAQVVRDLGYRYVVMRPTMYRGSIEARLPATDMFVDIALPDGGTLPLLVADELGASLTTEATDAILAEESAVEWSLKTIAGLVLDQQRGDLRADRSRVLTAPDLSALDARLIAALEPLVETTPSVRFTDASTLTGVTDVQRADGREVVVELPDAAGPDLVERVARLDATAIAMLSAGSMLPEGDPRPDEWSAQLGELISTGYREREVDAAIDELIAEAERLKDSVVAPEPFTFTLTGRSGDIDLRFGSTADEPLTVLVRFSSPKLAFPDGERLVELRPGEQTLVVVPVRARANGTSSVSVEMLTPAGEQIHDPVVLTSRVNALTGLGQVLTGGLILVLGTWWFSHWRRRRRERNAARAAAAAIATGDDSVVAGEPTGAT